MHICPCSGTLLVLSRSGYAACLWFVCQAAIQSPEKSQSWRNRIPVSKNDKWLALYSNHGIVKNEPIANLN